MIVVCSGCKNQITLDDATLPAGPCKVRCTGCGRSITVQRKEDTQKPVAHEPTPQPSINVTEKRKTTPTPSETTSTQSMEAYVDARISSAKREILDAMQALFRGSSAHQDDRMETNFSGKALVCSGDPKTTEALNAILTSMKYETQTSITSADSIKTVDGQFGLIVIDPSFTEDLEGAKKIIGRINIKKGIERRQTFVVLLTSTQKTLDGNAAFMSGVNLIVNKADISNLETYIRQSQKGFQQLYSTFKSFHATQ